MAETIHKPLQLRTAWNKAAVFSMVFSAMLTDAFYNCQDRIPGQIQDWRRDVQPQAPEVCYKVKKTVIRDFLFADDCALNAKTEETMQHETDCLCQGCDNFFITTSTKNTA